MLHPLGMSFHVLWGFSPTRVQQGRWLLRDLNSTAKWGSPPPSPHSKPQLRANPSPARTPSPYPNRTSTPAPTSLKPSPHAPPALLPADPAPLPCRRRGSSAGRCRSRPWKPGGAQARGAGRAVIPRRTGGGFRGERRHRRGRDGSGRDEPPQLGRQKREKNKIK